MTVYFVKFRLFIRIGVYKYDMCANAYHDFVRGGEGDGDKGASIMRGGVKGRNMESSPFEHAYAAYQDFVRGGQGLGKAARKDSAGQRH